jgi:hypothetical protein
MQPTGRIKLLSRRAGLIASFIVLCVVAVVPKLSAQSTEDSIIIMSKLGASGSTQLPRAQYKGPLRLILARLI